MSTFLPIASVFARPVMLATAVTSLAAAAVFVQDTAIQEKAPKSKAATAPTAAPQDPELQRWIEQLGSTDFEKRDAALDALRAKGKSALTALDDAASSSEDPEVRWNARRLARDIRDGQTSAAPEPSRSKADDSVRRNSGAWRTPRTFTIPPGSFPDVRIETDLKQFEEQMRDLRRNLDQFKNQFKDQVKSQLRVGPGTIQIGPGGSFFSSSNGVSIEVSDDHVRVEVTKKQEDGSEERKTYEAGSMEEFREKYPEIAEQYLDKQGAFPNFVMPDMKFDIPGITLPGGSVRIGIGNDPWNLALTPTPALEHLIGPENGQRLGVSVGEVPDAVRKFLSLQGQTGAILESVEEDSQASDLGLKAGDLLLSINGKTIGEGTTIREALASVPVGEKLRVEVIRGAEGRKQFEATKRKTEVKAEADEPAASQGAELKPIPKNKKVRR